ncbi:MAG: hypothetical protein ABEJ93_04995 [Candidatus Nanohalobium sp.]
MDKEEARRKALKETKKELTGSVDREKLVVKAVKYLDGLNQSIADEVEVIGDWYSLHFPELVEEIGAGEELLKILDRGLERSDLDSFQEMAENSNGMPLPEKDVEVLEEVVTSANNKIELRDQVESYIEETVKEEMPNLSKLLGSMLTAKLLGLVGGLEDLAEKPASTVQMLGAEKALFRYLSGEGTPPKHGVLYEHSFVNSLPEDSRGKMARFMANKASIAARLDFYGEKDKGSELRDEARQKFEKLRES